MVTPTDDFSHLDEPRTYREMFQRIMWLMEKDREDRADDRELLESFITKQDNLNKIMDSRFRELESCNATNIEAIGTLKKRVDGWNGLNSIGVVIASILAAFGLKGS